MLYPTFEKVGISSKFFLKVIEMSENKQIITYRRDGTPVYELQYETYLGEEIAYVVHENVKRYPVNCIGRILGYDSKHETQLYENNSKIVKKFAISLIVRGNKYATSIPCLDATGLLILTGRADLNGMPDERQETVIKVIDYMAESTIMRIKGELPTQLEYKQERDLSKRENIIVNNELKEHVVPFINHPENEPHIYSNFAIAIHKLIYGGHFKGIRDTGDIEQTKALKSALGWASSAIHMHGLKQKEVIPIIDEMLHDHYPKVIELRKIRKLEIDAIKAQKELEKEKQKKMLKEALFEGD